MPNNKRAHRQIVTHFLQMAHRTRLRRPGLTWLVLLALALPLLAQAVPARAAGPPATGPEFRVNTETGTDQNHADVGMDRDGNFAVVWEGSDGSNTQIYVRRYQADGTPLDSGQQLVNSDDSFDQSFPKIAVHPDGYFVVAWEGLAAAKRQVYWRRFDVDGNPLDANQQPVNNMLAYNKLGHDVAVDADGNFVVTWSDSDNYLVYARRFDSNGNPQGIGQQFQISGTGFAVFPSIAMDAGGEFVVGWMGLNSGTGKSQIYARRFASDGTPYSPQFLVDTDPNHNQGFEAPPGVAMDASGKIVIGWEQDDESQMYTRRYANDGTARDAFQVLASTDAAQQQSEPATASMDEHGNFVVAWDGDTPSEQVVYLRRFWDDGTPIDAQQVQVNTNSAQPNREAAVAMSPHGDFVVAWTREKSPDSVYARLYRLPMLYLGKSVSSGTPEIGDTITYTLVASSQVMTATGAVISDTIPVGLTYLGPTSIDPASAGTAGAPPKLVTDLTLKPGQTVTVTFPVRVGPGASDGQLITNTAILTTAQGGQPVEANSIIVVNGFLRYLPVLMK